MGVVGDPTPALDDTGTDRITIDVLVHLDGITPEEATAIFAHASRESYEPLGVELRVAEMRTATFLDRDERPEVDALAILNQTKALTGGRRPEGIDVVEALVGRDIHQLSLYAVAGLADCIGGVAHDDRAFAVGEMGVMVEDEAGLAIGPIAFYKDLTAKIAAHELGHLMGGHHHYQECGTGAPTAVGRGELGPCTLMTNAVDFQTLPFSTLNGVVVRGHAEEWASHNDAHEE